ncbi:MAG: ATP phosphoribosyltransferase regulatory subunit, partial [Microbacteriaceae bacterium]|nr:ATP phosphoribosyltransferase regulatory subunit [Microbacteriaceae bacterium]
FINRPQTLEFLPFGERQIRKALPDGFDSVAVANMVELGSILEAAIGGKAESLPLVFDPFLVRGMGYYTGAIFEAVHPTAGYSVGGGGRYDGMIGRFLGTDVPATGFSIGFERIIDLVEFDETATEDSVALIFDAGIDTSILMKLKAQLVSTGVRVRLERSIRNLKGLLDELAASGFSRFAQVGEATEVDQLTFKNLNQERK